LPGLVLAADDLLGDEQADGDQDQEDQQLLHGFTSSLRLVSIVR
jgi:hypothetical protein